MLSKIEELRRNLASGQVVFGLWSAVPSAFAAEIMVLGDPDYVCIDQQHGVIDYRDMVHMAAAVEARGSLPITRVPSNEPWLIGKALDGGLMGIIVPLVNTPEEAERLVRACRYPPRGVRSFGPIRTAVTMRTGALPALQTPLCIAMVETEEGLDNVDAIAQTPGLDGIYVGPADLALGLGLEPGLESADPVHAAAIERIRVACEKYGKFAGIQCASGASARAYAERGFGMVTVAKDSAMLQASSIREMRVARGGDDVDVQVGYS